MSKHRTVVGMFFALLLACALDGQVEPYYRLLFERGLFMMEAEADLTGAVPIFQEILKRHPHDRRYAALSQFYLGLCYKRMGSDSAIQAFQEVGLNFADQARIVRLAEAELASLTSPENPESQAQPESVPQRIWTGESVYGTGVLSSDGRFYVYVDRESGDLYLLEIPSRRARPLVRSGRGETGGGFAESAAISPDVRQVAYGWQNQEGRGELRVVNMDGSGQRTLFSDPGVQHARPMDWTPDADRILVCMVGYDLTVRVVFVSSRDGALHPVREMGVEWPDHMRLSPDGRCLAYSLLRSAEDPEHDIFLYSIAEQQETALVVQPGDDRLLGWTAEGGHILYISDRAGSADVFSLSIWEGKPRPPSRGIRVDLGPLHPVGPSGDRGFFYERKEGGEPRAGSGPGKTELWVIHDFFPEKNRILTVPDQFTTIQAAVSAADPGDTVYVRRGVYPENVTIDKSLSLLGEDRESTIIDGMGGESVIKITAGNVSVDGVTITNGQVGVDLGSAQPVRQVTLRNSIVTSNTRDGIHSRNSGGDHTIEGCILSHNGAYALNAHQFSRSVIRGCRVFGNGGGLRVGWGWHIRVEGNLVYQNGSTGIYPDSCYYSIFERNLIHANGELGIKLGYISSRNIIRENIILGHAEGIRVGLEWGGYSRNRIYHNDILHNQVQVGESRAGLAGFQQWDDGALSGGNFWSGYVGQDRDGNGIGDTPYPFLPGTRDDYPLVKPRNSIQAAVIVVPGGVKPSQRNGWITVRIELPAGLPVEEIDRTTLLLDKILSPAKKGFSIGDFDGDGIPDMRVRFRWGKASEAPRSEGNRELSITGKLKNGLPFEGTAVLETRR